VTILNFGTDLVAMVEDMVKTEAVRKASFDLSRQLQLFAEAEGATINVDETLRRMLQAVPDEASEGVTSSLSSYSGFLRAELRALIPDIDARVDRAVGKYQTLLQQFTAQADTGKLAKERCVRDSTPVLCEIIELFLSADVLARAVDAPLRRLNRFLVEETPIVEGVPVTLPAATEPIEPTAASLYRCRHGRPQQSRMPAFPLRFQSS
jgi:hypothetical protein